MSAGWVLVQTQEGVAGEVVARLVTLPGVESAERTAGAYDVVARVADLGPAVPSARRVVQAAKRVPGVTLAVACHDVPVDAEPGAEPLVAGTIDLRDLGTADPDLVDLTVGERTALSV